MEGITIKIKPFNILIMILTLITAAAVVQGTDAKVDEDSVYLLEEIAKYEENVKATRELVEKLKADAKKEKDKNEINNKSNYLDELVKMSSEIQKLKYFNGFTDVRGPGIMIRVGDNISEDVSIDIMDKIVHDVDITVLLNDLKGAGAEAIVVNGKRIINISEVVCAGPLLKINGEGVSAPFIISAIGDQESLYKAVYDEGTYGYELKNQWGMEVAIIKSYNLQIPRFYGDSYEINYAETIE